MDASKALAVEASADGRKPGHTHLPPDDGKDVGTTAQIRVSDHGSSAERDRVPGDV